MVPSGKMVSMKYVPLLAFQVVLIILFFVFVKYDGAKDFDIRGFEDTHVMIFVGFGFLMTFLKKYCYSALGLNWLLAALAVQWALLCQPAFTMQNSTIYITKKAILESDIMSATVLITFGALLGVASATQLLVITIVEVLVGSFNFWLCEHIFEISDIGGSIGIHTFGAYFGLGVSLAYRKRKSRPAPVEERHSVHIPAPAAPHTNAPVAIHGTGPAPVHAPLPAPVHAPPPAHAPVEINLNGPSYMSDVTAMIGSIFLWIYWPSFNSALAATDAEYQRAVVNTYLSLASATVTSFVMSSLVSGHHGVFDMVHIQNSTLAGGVAVGAICNMFIGPGGALAVGAGAGIISVLGYRFLTPKLERLGLLDTCGVHNLHGMPGVYSGLLSALFASLATPEVYGEELNTVFEALHHGRSAGSQGLNQLLALLSTLVISIGAGLATGFLTKIRIFAPLKEHEKYNDELNWELP